MRLFYETFVEYCTRFRRGIKGWIMLTFTCKNKFQRCSRLWINNVRNSSELKIISPSYYKGMSVTLQSIFVQISSLYWGRELCRPNDEIRRRYKIVGSFTSRIWFFILIFSYTLYFLNYIESIYNNLYEKNYENNNHKWVIFKLNLWNGESFKMLIWMKKLKRILNVIMMFEFSFWICKVN